MAVRPFPGQRVIAKKEHTGGCGCDKYERGDVRHSLGDVGREVLWIDQGVEECWNDDAIPVNPERYRNDAGLSHH